MTNRITLILLLICTGLLVKAQPSNDNCSSALPLCPGISYTSTTGSATTEICATCADGTTSTGAFCFDYDNTIWFTFTTNSAGGNASVDIGNISCLTAPDYDNELQGVIVSASAPCNSTTYTAVSNCEPNSSAGFTLTAAGLLPSTTYYVMIDGDLNGAGVANPASCEFSIVVSGNAVEWIATTSTTSQSCGNTDGSIQVNSVSGGTAPYQYSINGGAFQSSNAFNNLTAGSYAVYAMDASGCTQFLDTVVVDLLNGPQDGQANITSATCNDADGVIDITGVTGGTTPYTYSINGGTPQSSATFNNLVAGSYTIVIADAQGCTQTLEVTVPNNSGPTGGVPNITHPSCGNNDGELTFSISGGTSPLFYSLNGGPSQSQNLYENLSPGSYSVVITDANGCTYTINYIVLTEQTGTLVTDISITSSANPACTGDQITYSSSVTNGGSNPQIEWFVNGVLVQTGGSTYSSSINSGDIVSATVVSDDPCVAVTSASSNQINQEVLPVTSPAVSITSSATAACSNEPVTFNATSSGCSGSATYQWNFNGSSVASDTTTQLITTVPQSSSVEVTMICSDACALPATSNTINITITEIFADAGEDQVIFQGGSAQLEGSGGSTYSWQPATSLTNPNIADPIATPGATTTYYLTVTADGCTDEDEVTVHVLQPVSVPNTFTPNGDGVNDFWEIRRIEEFPNCKVTVYDRWGQRVFNSIGYSNGNSWDGTFHGAKLPAATYYYVIDLNSGATGGGDVYAGSITIVY